MTEKRQHWVGEVDRPFREGLWTPDQAPGMACAMIAIDRYYHHISKLGHRAGDYLLESVAATVQMGLSASGLVTCCHGGRLLVLKPSPDLVDAWLWVQALRCKIESLKLRADCDPMTVTVCIGVAHTARKKVGWPTVRAAVEALTLTRHLGFNTICTAEMATVSRQLEEVVVSGARNIEQRRLELLRRLAPRLGPIQCEHLTNHCERVSDISVHIARLMNLGSEETQRVRVAGLMHDIGKCVIPEELLGKPRPLSAKEWQLVAYHEDCGDWIAGKLGLDKITSSYIRYHHRRYDAHGDTDRHGISLPRRIPLGAQVLCVADALVTMLSKRPYCAARPVGHALAELRQQRGQQFHPDVVDAALRFESFSKLLAA